MQLFVLNWQNSFICTEKYTRKHCLPSFSSILFHSILMVVLLSSRWDVQTWSTGRVDPLEQLYAALVGPVVEDSGEDVKISIRKGVLEEVP